MKKKIAVLFGGNSSESEISMKSGKQVANWLDKELFEVYLILVTGNNWVWYDKQEIKVDRNDFSMVIDGKHIAFDFAYIMIHGTPGENGLMGGYFEMMGIPHSTCKN
jgi:D-alanine-D-alanine ligase